MRAKHCQRQNLHTHNIKKKNGVQVQGRPDDTLVSTLLHTPTNMFMSTQGAHVGGQVLTAYAY